MDFQSITNTQNNNTLTHEREEDKAMRVALANMNLWRDNKRSGEPIPEELWRQIFALNAFFSATKIRSKFSISKKQYDNRYRQLMGTPTPPLNQSSSQQNSQSSSQQNSVLDNLCEALTKEAPPQPQTQNTAPKPSIYTSTPDDIQDTLVVEIFRSDGQRMCIHMTRQQIPELLNAFCPLKEEVRHATAHP